MQFAIFQTTNGYYYFLFTGEVWDGKKVVDFLDELDDAGIEWEWESECKQFIRNNGSGCDIFVLSEEDGKWLISFPWNSIENRERMCFVDWGFVSDIVKE